MGIETGYVNYKYWICKRIASFIQYGSRVPKDETKGQDKELINQSGLQVLGLQRHYKHLSSDQYKEINRYSHSSDNYATTAHFSSIAIK
jgi:hypothetical protein